jgi:hypothetical protein
MAQLTKALDVSVRPERQGDTLVLGVTLTNTGAGHALPTGMPGRRVLLAVHVRTSDGKTFDDERVYGKRFTDAAGKDLVRDSAYFAKGVRLVSDTRIKADERRSEEFAFPVAAGATAYVTVKLHYEHKPTGDDENGTWITFFSADRTVAPGSRG